MFDKIIQRANNKTLLIVVAGLVAVIAVIVIAAPDLLRDLFGCLHE
ncbi:MAG: hypothetical protein JW884_06255 [Deltaproteobacteria bacterium]|nr:hypothetical protein [Deltaproteobacteria bacterium]